MKPMTPQEVEKKYRKPDGSIHIPGDVKIVMPSKSQIMAEGWGKMTLAHDSKSIVNMEYKDGKVYIDGVETPQGNRAQRRAKK